MSKVMRSLHHALWTALAIVAVACGPTVSAPASPAAAPASPAALARLDVLRVAGGDRGYPTPYAFVRGPGWVNMSFSFDTLVWKDSQKTIPWLATEWTSSADGTRWSFTLRDGVRWHDGKPFTAADVAFTVDYFKKNTNSWYAGDVDLIREVRVVDARHVELILRSPYAPFLESIAGGLVIIPKHIWESVSDPRRFSGPEAVIGTGPYRLVSYDKATGAYLYEANAEFFLGAPYVKRIEMVPTANELVSLAKGEIDAGGPGVQVAATDEVLAPFRDPAKYGMISAPGEWTMGLYFNLGRGGALADRAVRQAVAYAIDRKDLLERIIQGKGRVGNPGYLPVANPWHNANVEQYPFDVGKAKDLLERSGYVDRDGDGVRESPDGKPLRFELPFASSDSPRNAELVRDYLKAVGIGITPRSVDGATRDAAATEGRYDVILTGSGGLGADPDKMRGAFSSKSKERGHSRVHGYANARFDALAEQQLSTADPAARRKLLDEMQAIIATDVPMLGLYYPDRYHIFRRATLDEWFYTPGGVGGGVPTALNKLLLATGRRSGVAR